MSSAPNMFIKYHFYVNIKDFYEYKWKLKN